MKPVTYSPALPDIDPDAPPIKRLEAVLAADLNFHGQDSSYASHHYHSFPAKFPPQLPHLFIQALTRPGEVVFDPMAGSGTTLVEAYLAGRQAWGTDIDPLALLLSRVKVTPIAAEDVLSSGQWISQQAAAIVNQQPDQLEAALNTRWEPKTRRFVNYWFAPETQLELLALLQGIHQIDDLPLRNFFKLVFSGIIITKSGGVSQAFDLAHTRPHRARIIYSQQGELLLGHERAANPSPRDSLLTKRLRSPLDDFEKRYRRSAASLLSEEPDRFGPLLAAGDARHLPLAANSVDLIVTSPPYAANAIDYMRAHKFSLVWLGYPIDRLGQMRGEYIGGEATSTVTFERLDGVPAQIVQAIAARDAKRGKVVHRYYSEMTGVLRELYRVLKPGKAAVMVVGTSIIKGVDIQIGGCLVEIGRQVGFEVPAVGVRDLDRDRRMLPVSAGGDNDSQIQQRMHDEYVIGFYKPPHS